MKKVWTIILLIVSITGMLGDLTVFAASCTLSEISEVQQGEVLEINGTAQGANYYVTLYLKDQNNNVKFVDLVNVSDQKFSRKISIPFSWNAGEYTAIAGFGNITAVKKFNVTSVGEFINIETLTYNVDQYSTLELPDRITAVYENSNAVLENPEYTWESALNLDKAGQYKALGKVIDMYGIERKFNVVVNVLPLRIEKILDNTQKYEFEIGDTITLPKYILVSLSNRKEKYMPVEWTPDPATVLADSVKTVRFIGKIDEYDKNIESDVVIKEVSDTIPQVGISLWLEADENYIQTDSNGNMVQWKNKTGSDNIFSQVSNGNSVTLKENSVNKHTAVVFKDSAVKSSKDTAYTGDSTVFVVAKLNSLNDGVIMSTGDSSSENALEIQVRDKKIIALSSDGSGNSSSVIISNNIDTDNYHIFGLRVTGGIDTGKIDTFYDDSTVRDAYIIAKDGKKFNSYNGYTIASKGSSDKYINMELCELVVYQRNMSDEQVKRIHNYLYDKYLLEEKYSVSAYAGLTETNLSVRSNVTNSTSKSLNDTVLIQTLKKDNVMLKGIINDVPEIASLSGISVRNTFEWSGEVPECQAILLKSIESMIPLAISSTDDYISSNDNCLGKAVITRVEIINNCVTLTGRLDSGSEKYAVIIVADNKDNISDDSLLNAGVAKTDADGKFVYSFDLPDTDSDGNPIDTVLYTTVGGEGVSKSEVKEFGFAGREIRESVFKMLKEASHSTISSMLASGSEYRNALSALGVGVEVYDKLDSDGKSEFVKKISDIIKEIEGSSNEAILQFGEKIKKIYPLIEINQAANENDVANVMDKYSQELGLESFDDFYLKYIFANIPYINNEEFNNVIDKADMYKSINNANFVSISKILTDNDDLFNTSSEFVYYKNLNDSGKQIVNKYIVTELSRNQVYTKEALLKLLSDAVNDYKNSSKNNASSKPSGSGGGGSGGGNSNGTTGSIGVSDIWTDTPTDAIVEKVVVFDDLESVPWAKDAILNLKDKNIINGKSETKFCPSDFITREEFVKLIISVFDINTDGASCHFNDCDENAWYYPYVSAAARDGIVYGITDTEYGIGRNISRAQMAVICQRALSLNNIQLQMYEEKISFKDEDLIPEYAKTSIEIMQQAGIIHGTDEGNFNPQGFATRAEAAVVINLVLAIL